MGKSYAVETEQFNDMYWNPDKLLSRNKLMNFVVGSRGGGKSFGVKRMCINRFLKKGTQFFYLRRYEAELNRVSTFFDDIKPFYPEHEFKVKGGNFYIDNEICGYYQSLNTGYKLKSSSFPLVTVIFFDEFLVEKGQSGYLKNEVEMFLHLFETIARMRENCVAIFVANATSVINPYFSNFGIVIRPGSRFTMVGEEVCVEMFSGVEYQQAKKATRFGKFIDGTPLGEHMIENKFYRDNSEFVSKMTGQCFSICKIVYNGKEYTLWRSPKGGRVYFNKVKSPDNLVEYCVTLEDHSPNYLLLRTLKNYSWFKEVQYAYDMGIVRFDSLEAKNDFYEIMEYV